MNDKFFKLGREATLWCCDNLNPDTTKEEWDAEWEDKFAELIVRECVNTVNKRYMGDNNREDMEVRRCVEDLKKHFGVE